MSPNFMKIENQGQITNGASLKVSFSQSNVFHNVKMFAEKSDRQTDNDKTQNISFTFESRR
jgi:hypothetical protein